MSLYRLNTADGDHSSPVSDVEREPVAPKTGERTATGAVILNSNICHTVTYR